MEKQTVTQGVEFPDSWYDEGEFATFYTNNRLYLNDMIVELENNFDEVRYHSVSEDGKHCKSIHVSKGDFTYTVWLKYGERQGTVESLRSHYGVPSKPIYKVLLDGLGVTFCEVNSLNRSLEDDDVDIETAA